MELIQINKDVRVGQEVIQTVNARELHGFLKNGKMYAHWIKERIERYGFIDGVDYTTEYLPKQAKTPGRPPKEYHVSIGMAKELAMVERNDQGKQARLYFIECERKLQEVAPVSTLPSYPDALRQLAATLERNEQQAVQIAQQTTLIEAQKPAVEFVDKYVTSDGTMNFRNMAKLLGAKEQDFRNFLYDNKYRFREGTKWMHYKKWDDSLGNAGYFTMKVGVSPSSGLAYQQSYFTPKGVEFFTRKWNERKPVLTKKPTGIPKYTSYNT